MTTADWFAIIGNVPSEQKICESGGIGRRARLRGVCLRRTGSSPVSRTRRGFLHWNPLFTSRRKSSPLYADMAELADALDSGSNGRKFVQVQVLLSAPTLKSLDNQQFSLIIEVFVFTLKSYPKQSFLTLFL